MIYYRKANGELGAVTSDNEHRDYELISNPNEITTMLVVNSDTAPNRGTAYMILVK